jgi:ComF family protein
MKSTMTKHLSSISEKTVDFLLPPLCPATGELVDKLGMVDPTFWQKLNFIHAPYCERCGAPFAFEASHLQCGACVDHPPIFNKARSALFYDDGSRDLILRFKHGDQTHAVKAFIPWLKQIGHEMLQEADIILPVPLHPFRLIKRRYNQAALITQDLKNHYPDLTHYPDGLIRTKNTQSQGHKKRAEREKNVKQAFLSNPKYNFEGKTVLIVDDVYTTGATLNECAKTLYRSGAKEVNALTIARVIHD